MGNVSATFAAIVAALLLIACAGDDAGPSTSPSSPSSSVTASARPTFQATQVNEIHADITARSAELKAEGADVALVNIDAGGRVVVVTLRGDITKGTAVLHARYPREALRIERGDVGH